MVPISRRFYLSAVLLLFALASTSFAQQATNTVSSPLWKYQRLSLRAKQVVPNRNTSVRYFTIGRRGEFLRGSLAGFGGAGSTNQIAVGTTNAPSSVWITDATGVRHVRICRYYKTQREVFFPQVVGALVSIVTVLDIKIGRVPQH